jgi:sirohydrochlorin ferrochelatase
MTGPVLVAVAHGTRDPAGAAVTRALLRRVHALRPELDLRSCALGLSAPGLEETLAGLRGDVVLVPLLLGAGHHVRADLPRALAGAPHLRARAAAALGPHPLLARTLVDRLARCGRSSGPVVLAAAGSGEEAANDGTRAMAALLSARLGHAVVPAFLSGAGPRPGKAVEELRAAGHREVTVAPYLLGPGFFAREAARTTATRTAAPLGAHDALAWLVALRYDEAYAAGLPAGRARVATAPAGAGAEDL